LGVVAIAGFYGWGKYDDWRKANVEQAAQQDHRRLVDACETRYSTSGYEKSGPWAKYVDVQATYEQNPNEPWNAKFNADVRHGNVIEIHDGDALQITPPQKFTQGSADFIPTIFLGHHRFTISSAEKVGTRPRQAKSPSCSPCTVGPQLSRHSRPLGTGCHTLGKSSTSDLRFRTPILRKRPVPHFRESFPEGREDPSCPLAEVDGI
jgi:hypothetical protein